MDIRRFELLYEELRREGFHEAAKAMRIQQNSELLPGDIFIHKRSGDEYVLVEELQTNLTKYRTLQMYKT